ncbi:MAG: hypothetical protein OK422_05045 [Thaumarchaeota archaeon]|nr:hypothetical protein [Nitrososphaerota archaeon]
MFGSRKKSAGQLNVLAGLLGKIGGALPTQTGATQSGADSKKINLEAIRQAEQTRVRMDSWKAEQYLRLKRA